MAATSVTAAEGSAARSLAEWANSQDGWIRLLAQSVLLERVTLDELKLDACYKQLLAEKGLVVACADQINDIDVAETLADEVPSIRLVKISNTEHVNRLLPDQTLKFNHRMTVIYGENASGKTGYVRVLKAVAGSRTAETVLPDIYRTATVSPSATIVYQLGAKTEYLEWSDGATTPPALSRISVFDPPVAPLHVDDDLSYSYMPSEIALFEIVHSGIDQIRGKLIAELNKRKPTGNPFLSRFQRGTRVYHLIETLRATTRVRDLRALAGVDDNDNEKVKHLRSQIRNLDDNNLHVKVAGTRSARSQCASGRAVVDALLGFSETKYKEALAAIVASRARVKSVTKELFLSDTIPGLFTEDWQRFISTADEYVTQHFHRDPADSPAACPYCAQPLGNEARKRLEKYKTYLTDQAQSTLRDAMRELSEMCTPIETLTLSQSPQELEKESSSSEASWAVGLQKVSGILARQKQLIKDGMPWDLPNEFAAELQAVRKTLDDQWKASNELVLYLNAESEDRQKRLAECRVALRDLEDRLTLSQLLSAIEEHIEMARWVDLASTVARSFQGVLKSLTIATKAATREILSSNFETAFEQECVSLSCPPVRLEFPGRQGATLRHKSVGTNYRLGKVLSEGEQKVIALADFLAEVSLRPSSAPIVFDDPVTSLDARRTDEVAHRLVQLSARHQVVVFTHHLHFASKLLSTFQPKELRDQCSFFEVLAEDGSVGLVLRGTHPRMDTVSAIKGRVHKTLQDARASSGSARDELVVTAYGHLRAWIETFVEDQLLQGSVKRYRANISIDALAAIDGNTLETKTGVLKAIYDRASRRIWSHSQPYDQLQSRPTIDEIESDWEMLKEVQS